MALDSVTSMQLSLTINWAVGKTRTGLQPVTNQQTLQHRVAFTKGVGSDQINELVCYIHTVPAGTTVDIDLSAALTNVVNDPTVTLARVKFLFVKLLATADLDEEGNTIGNGCTGITLGGDANSFPFLKDPTDKLDLGNGDFHFLSRRSATGIVVTPSTGDILQIQNTDGGVDAKVLLLIGGAAS